MVDFINNVRSEFFPTSGQFVPSAAAMLPSAGRASFKFRRFRKIPKSVYWLPMSVCVSVSMEELGSQWAEYV